jgi:hypothetical protein
MMMVVDSASETHKTIPPLPHTNKSDLPFPLVPFNPEGDINLAMQLIQLAWYPWHFTGEVDFIA